MKGIPYSKRLETIVLEKITLWQSGKKHFQWYSVDSYINDYFCTGILTCRVTCNSLTGLCSWQIKKLSKQQRGMKFSQKLTMKIICLLGCQPVYFMRQAPTVWWELLPPSLSYSEDEAVTSSPQLPYVLHPRRQKSSLANEKHKTSHDIYSGWLS